MSPDKLRINSDELGGGFESAENELTSTNHPIFVCKLCGKEFGSGKALGGHMRVHAQQQRPAVLKNNLNHSRRSAGEKKSSYLDDLVKDGNPTCSLCSKTFPSPKSLFGHMRCHPEREWRGMRPPPPLNSTPISCNPSSTVSYLSRHNSVSSTTPVDLLQPLSGWSMKKSRRSRNITNEAVVVADAAVAVAVAADNCLPNSAVHGLMLLAATKDRISDDEDHHSSYGDNSAIGNKKKRKTAKLKDLSSPPPPVAAKCYKCTTCDKVYPSPQALGGHRSSAHNNKTTSVKDGSSKTNSIHDHDHDQQAITAMHPPPAEVLTTLAVVPHICKICYKMFPSGQALGGHKRCHWQPPTATTGGDHPPAESSAALEHPPPPSSSSSSSPGQSAQTTMKPLLDFDLNELPAEYHFC